MKKSVVVWEARVRGREKWVRVGTTRFKPGEHLSLTATLFPDKFVEVRVREETK